MDVAYFWCFALKSCFKACSNPFFPSKVNQWSNKERDQDGDDDIKAGGTMGKGEDFGIHTIDTGNQHRRRKHTR